MEQQEEKPQFEVFYDVETSGLKAWENEIIQIAGVAYRVVKKEGGGEVWKREATFEALLQFDQDKADQESLKGNSYNAERWGMFAVEPGAAVRQFCEFVAKYRCVEKVGKKGKPYAVAKLWGHNILKFDNDFFWRAQRKAGVNYFPELSFCHDTMQLVRFYEHLTGKRLPNHRLTTIAEHFGIPTDGAHDALADVKMNAKCAKSMLDEIRSVS